MNGIRNFRDIERLVYIRWTQNQIDSFTPLVGLTLALLRNRVYYYNMASTLVGPLEVWIQKLATLYGQAYIYIYLDGNRPIIMTSSEPPQSKARLIQQFPCSDRRISEASSSYNAAEKNIRFEGCDHRLTSSICEAQGNIMAIIIDSRNVIEICPAMGGSCGRWRNGIEQFRVLLRT